MSTPRSGIALAPLVAAAGMLALAAPAAASPPPWAPAHGWRAQQPVAVVVPQPVYADPRFTQVRGSDRRSQQRAARRAYEQGYRDALRQQQRFGTQPAYYDPWSQARPLNRRDVVWQGRDGRTYCRRNDGTTGVVVGAIAGGTLGNVIAGDGQRRLGSILGGSIGAIIGRELDRGNVRCY
ncbi:MAG: glycine zipper 2TM domain-containing protein [Thermaurantiacus sp.]